MYRKIFFIAVCAALLGQSSNAQNTREEAYQKGLERISKISAQERADYYRKHHARKPSAEEMEKLQKSAPVQAVMHQKDGERLEMPERFWFPGEFEEVQAILITWTYLHVHFYDNEDYDFVEPIDGKYAYWYDEKDNLQVGDYESFIDLDDEYSRLPIISAQLANAIQQGGAEVWINIVNPADSVDIKEYMDRKGMPLKNYRFFVNPTNSIWYRDCGPVAFYYGKHDEIAFLDFEYYSGRAADDKIPIGLGKQLNIPVYTTAVKYEGGNIILDGAGSLFTSDEVYTENNSIYGQVYIDKGELKTALRNRLSRQQVDDSLSYLLGLDRLKALPRLRYDGGTGHIDLYAAMWDENNFVFTKYPPQMKNLTDYSIGLRNIDTILSMYSYFGKKYRGRDIPLPMKDNKTWYTTNADYSRYTRTYSNSTFVNDVIIQPVFSDDTWGARDWDLAAIEQMKKVFPGYTIIPIDIRGFKNDSYLYTGFDGTGGAIHCITKQIPAENPIRILHNAIQDFADDAVYNGKFPIEANITNKSGIASATCLWREKGATHWQKLPLVRVGGDRFSAVLNRPTTLAHDTIEYCITATSNNGKSIAKPITAPKGFYSFYHGREAVKEVVKDIYDYITDVPNLSYGEMKMSNFFPNPADHSANIVLMGMANENINISINNILGQTIYANSVFVEENETVLQLNTSSFSAGVYVVSFTNSKGVVTAKKLVVGR